MMTLQVRGVLRGLRIDSEEVYNPSPKFNSKSPEITLKFAPAGNESLNPTIDFQGRAVGFEGRYLELGEMMLKMMAKVC